ncbi:hypothetical protein [Microcoleus vaginatus]|uniref:hypothetical protein n=1 Tax=Microcoleus vaginatus TaxID=119532 RepID=UPI004040B9EA
MQATYPIHDHKSIDNGYAVTEHQFDRKSIDRVEQTQRDAIPQLLAMGLTVEQVAQTLFLSVENVQRLG